MSADLKREKKYLLPNLTYTRYSIKEQTVTVLVRSFSVVLSENKQRTLSKIILWGKKKKKKLLSSLPSSGAYENRALLTPEYI